MRRVFPLIGVMLFVELILFAVLARLGGPLLPLASVLLSGAIGLSLLRQGQVRTFARLREATATGGSVPAEVADELLRVGGGLLFLIPGLLSDLLGALLLIPPVRRKVAARLRAPAREPFVEQAPARRHFKRTPEEETDAEIIEDVAPPGDVRR